jgi:hypothetical protein
MPVPASARNVSQCSRTIRYSRRWPAAGIGYDPTAASAARSAGSMRSAMRASVVDDEVVGDSAAAALREGIEPPAVPRATDSPRAGGMKRVYRHPRRRVSDLGVRTSAGV